jgi:succinyl-diaminopimelate desuccinylase
MMDVLNLTQQLVRIPSVTPHDPGCLDLIESLLTPAGFVCHRVKFEDVDNLYARWGNAGNNVCFAGHVDVVPAGDLTRWTNDPYAPTVRDGCVYGRGVVDMKGAIAAFVLAALDWVKTPQAQGNSLSFLLTADEEGPALHGTQAMIPWLREKGEQLHACLVGEPTNPEHVGDMIKIGRRGSLNARIAIQGKGGHSAYPHLAQNPISPLLTFLADLKDWEIDTGMSGFDPSHVEITTIDVDNPTSNMIPSSAEARFNIRYTPLHTSQSLGRDIRALAEQIIPLPHELITHATGEAFLCEALWLQETLSEAVLKEVGRMPVLSTTGGTSDARFIKDLCPVVEFGLVNATAHHANEHVAVTELALLQRVYTAFLNSPSLWMDR